MSTPKHLGLLASAACDDMLTAIAAGHADEAGRLATRMFHHERQRRERNRRARARHAVMMEAYGHRNRNGSYE